MYLSRTKHSFLGDNLKVIRLYNNLPQHKVAKHMSVERCTYTCWELGKTEPSFNDLQNIVEFYNNLESCDLEVDYNMLLTKPLFDTDLSVYRKRIT